MSRRSYLILLLLLVSGVYVYTAAGRAVLDDGDALYAHIAQVMAQSGDWVTPYANGARFLDKPPMMFWLMAAAYHIFGFSEFAARFPSALAVLGTAVLLFLMGRRAGIPSAGFIAAGGYAFCVGTFLFTRMVFPDVLFVFFLTFAIFIFSKWYLDAQKPLMPALLFYAAMAGAALTKGFIGLVFPGAIVFFFLLWEKDLACLRRFHLLKGSLLFLALAVPWHLLAALRNPGFLWYFFLNEQVYRFLGKRQPLDYESIPMPVFWLLVLAWLFPWSAFFPAMRHVVRNSRDREDGVRCTIRLCVCWILVLLVFFSLSSRIEHYAMPIFPPLALFIGMVLSPKALSDLPRDARLRRSVARGYVFLASLGGLMALLLIVAAAWLHGGPAGDTLNPAATSRLHAYKYYFAPLFEMPPDILERLKTPFAGTCIVLAAGFLTAWWLNRRSRRLAAIMALNLTVMGFCLFAWQSLGICEGMISSKQFGRQINRLYRPGDSVVVVGDFETANSINFYAPPVLRVYGGTAALLQWGLRYPDAPKVLLSRNELQGLWESPHRAFLLAPMDQLPALGLQTAYPVLRSGGRTLICNLPVP